MNLSFIDNLPNYNVLLTVMNINSKYLIILFVIVYNHDLFTTTYFYDFIIVCFSKKIKHKRKLISPSRCVILVFSILLHCTCC